MMDVWGCFYYYHYFFSCYTWNSFIFWRFPTSTPSPQTFPTIYIIPTPHKIYIHTCSVSFIHQVAGDANEEQIILSIQKYTVKCDLLLRSLNDLFQLCRYSECRNQRIALQVCVIAEVRYHWLIMHFSNLLSRFLPQKGVCHKYDKIRFVG
jgi:hypothetical protein